MKSENSKTREQYPLSKKKILKKTLQGSFSWFLILPFLYLFAIYIFVINPSNQNLFVPVTLSFFVLYALVVLLTYLYQLWYYNVYFYDLTDDYVIIRKGPVTPHEITIPYERIQDIYTDQDLFDRILGLYDVYISSATISSGVTAHIDGVAKPAADGLRELLLKTVSKKIGGTSKSTNPDHSQ